jgi:hypothetical protein
MIKVSKSFNDIDNKVLLVLLSKQKIYENVPIKEEAPPIHDKCKDLVSKLELSNIDIHENKVDFEKILKFDEIVLENKIREVKDSENENFEKKESILIGNYKKLACVNFNKSCSKCHKNFKNYEKYHRMLENIFLDKSCCTCEFCNGNIDDVFAIKKTHSNLNSDNDYELKYQFFHSNCYYGQEYVLLCFFCRKDIHDKSYSILNGLTYHSNCLKCWKCNSYLSDQKSISEFMSNFYCFECSRQLNIIFNEKID